MERINLTSNIRNNLLSLQKISRQVSSTQNILATGQKVNSAIDNPSSYYTARSLSDRAADLTSLLDSMGQSLQTVKTALEGIDTATEILQQMLAVTEQTLTEAEMIPHQVEVTYDRDVAALIAQGYTAVDSSTTAAELQALLNTDDAKVVLTEDVSFSGNLTFRGKNIVVNGGGHKLTMQSGNILNYGANAVYENMQIESNYGKNGWYTRGIYSEGADTTVRNMEIVLNGVKSAGHGVELHGGGTVENLNIKLNGSAEQLIGVYVWGKSSVSNVNTALSGGGQTLMAAVASSGTNVSIDKIGMTADGGRAFGVLGQVKGVESHAVGGSVDKNSSLFTGKANTDAILADIGSEGLAASAADQFYVGDKNGDFGQGNWYLPSIAELMNVYGTDTDKITNGWWSTSGAVGDNKKAINAALSQLKAAGVEAETLTNGYYWSSSGLSRYYSWLLYVGNGGRGLDAKYSSYYVRCFQLLENCFDPSSLSAAGTGGGDVPQVGYVMYDDKSWGSADDYAAAQAAGKTAVGVITEVLDDGSVKIMNLKDLTFSSSTAVGNFDPDNPYGGSTSTTRWSTGSNMYKDVEGVENFSDWELVLAMNPNAQVVDVQTLNSAFAQIAAEPYQSRYNDILNQYDNVINDSSYKGINMLKDDKLNVVFNEDSSSNFEVSGKDMSSEAVGLSLSDWAEKEGILQSVKELQNAVQTLRSFSAELGNSYSIVTTRQEFTEKLINVLTEGADKLILADMNEESANMLALQVRQQLALTSLSLASNANNSVLKLF